MDPNNVIDIQVAGTITLTTPLQMIGKNVTINTTAAGITVERSANPGTASFRIFTIPGSASTCTFNNVTVQKGKTDTTSDFNEGAGIYNAGTLTLNNCIVQTNDAKGHGSGGGIFNATGATLTLNGTAVVDNTAEDGAGIYDAGTLTVQPDTNNQISEIVHNTARGNGGGIYANGTETLTAASIRQNEAANGGGVYNYSGSFTMSGGTFSTNKATVDGGGVYSVATTSISAGVQMVSNNALRNGGGYYVDAGTTTFTNCTFNNNTAVGTGNAGDSRVGTTTRPGSTGQLPADYVEFM
jgi:hypothetical protein